MNTVNKDVYKSIIVVNKMDLIDSEEEIIDIIKSIIKIKFVNNKLLKIILALIFIFYNYYIISCYR